MHAAWCLSLSMLAKTVALGADDPTANLAAGATATASESYGGLTPEKAIDGRADTRWSGIPGHNQDVWFQLDWAAPVTIGEVVIHQYERYTWEMDVQVWDDAAGDWRTMQHFGQPNRQLPKVIVARFAPVRTTRLRIGNITNGPSFTEVQVFADAALAHPPALRLASDLQGHFIGIATDPWGLDPVGGLAVTLSGESHGGPWRRTVQTDEKGLFFPEMPVGMTGTVRAEAAPAAPGAPAGAPLEVEAASFQYGLTPRSSGDHEATSLDGSWRFLPDPPEGFWDPAFDDSLWSSINVPAHWEMEGFQSADGIGGYRRQFRAPGGEGSVKLRFEGVYSGAEVWVNGQLVATHEGGATPFEADVTDAVHGGDNLLAVRVKQHTVCSDSLDNMSFYADFPLAGIMRSVRVFRVPAAHIGALALATELKDSGREAVLSGTATVLNESDHPLARGSLQLRLTDPEGRAVPLPDEALPVEVGSWGRSDVALSVPVAAPQTWQAEHPRLYHLTLELREDGRVVQRLVQRIGFRQTQVRGSEILINGTPVKLRGTCHHDVHPLMGRAVTPEVTRQDLTLMKEANLNALRTSHYPPIPELVDIADELGVYVEDEAPFCWVGVSNDLQNAPRILQLTAELVARDRNHPSVFMWSLCNESEFGWAFERSHEWVRAADPSRPTSAATSAWLEIATLHNPITIGRIEEQEGLDKPLLFDESLCIYQGIWGDLAELWVDPGIRDYYAEPLPAVYERFMRSKVTQGSFIWCWADDLSCVPNRGFEYGRGPTRSHFVDEQYRVPGRGLVGDAPWGVIDGWRRPKPEFWITKKLHSPVKVSEGPLPVPAAGQPIIVPVENQYDFTDLSELKVLWEIGDQWGAIAASVPPRTHGELQLTPRSAPRRGQTLTLRFLDRHGQLVDAYCLPFGEARHAMPPTARPAGGGRPAALRVQDESIMEGGATRIIGQGFELAVDRGAGGLRRCVGFGEPLLVELPMLHVLPTATPLSPLPDRLSWRVQGVDVTPEGDDVRVHIAGAYEQFTGSYDLVVTPAGEITVTSAWDYTGPDLLAREVGMRFSVPRTCDLLQWDRNAEWSVYPSDHIGRPRGETRAFATHAAGAPPTWPWSQDNSPLGCNDFRSTKRHINWAAIRYPGGPGLVVESDGSQHLRAMADSDRISVHVNDWYGGTNVGMWEWKSNYGEGRLLKTGERIESRLRLRIAGAVTQ